MQGLRITPTIHPESDRFPITHNKLSEFKELLFILQNDMAICFEASFSVGRIEENLLMVCVIPVGRFDVVIKKVLQSLKMIFLCWSFLYLGIHCSRV